MVPSIVERRNELARRLAQSLSNDFIVVAAPDHPLVLRSVDLLVGGRSGLTAVMMSTAEERRRPTLFAARLALNMIALPPHTNFVRLVVDEDKPAQTDNAFAEELELGDRGAQAALLRIVNNPAHSRQLDRAEKAQKRSEERFANTYRLARVLRRGFQAEEGLKRRGPVSRTPSRDQIGNQVNAAFFSATPTLTAMNNLAMSEAGRWYDIVDGEAEPRNAMANALFVPDYPEVKGDPDKALRAAAFAGWVMVPSRSARSLDDVGILIERYGKLK
ncbi:hypothetical protein [Acetobacter okinawensis]|uniref:hypothetical protein n=1 Tax=Acetobacter okinawensis TaxID=1076594 RepID=UPI0020A1102D|nr:hypothetical protein [Acetobacter okinawensis]MCP1213884.1 hypothetical protein [Acetobacter okinawensis]